MNRITYPMLMRSLTAAKPKNRWLQFSLRILLILAILVCVGFGFYGRFAYKMRIVQRQEKAIHTLQVSGIGINFDYEFDIRNGAVLSDSQCQVARTCLAESPVGRRLRSIVGRRTSFGL